MGGEWEGGVSGGERVVEGRGSTGEGVVALGARRRSRVVVLGARRRSRVMVLGARHRSRVVVLGARSEVWGGKGGARSEGWGASGGGGVVVGFLGRHSRARAGASSPFTRAGSSSPFVHAGVGPSSVRRPSCSFCVRWSFVAVWLVVFGCRCLSVVFTCRGWCQWAWWAVVVLGGGRGLLCGDPLCSSRVLVVSWFHVVVGSWLCCVVVVGL